VKRSARSLSLLSKTRTRQAMYV